MTQVGFFAFFICFDSRENLGGLLEKFLFLFFAQLSSLFGVERQVKMNFRFPNEYEYGIEYNFKRDLNKKRESKKASPSLM